MHIPKSVLSPVVRFLLLVWLLGATALSIAAEPVTVHISDESEDSTAVHVFLSDASDLIGPELLLVQDQQPDAEGAAAATPPTETDSSAPATPPTRTDSPAPGEEGISLRGLSEQRRASGSATGLLSGSESFLLPATDAGGFLGKSGSITGVGFQQRNPIVTDVRTRGYRVGQLLASGSYWVPARLDLDTLLSKIDPRIIDNMLVIKGPYSALYGPGFNFIDFELLPAPRFPSGPESGGTSSIEYQTNGQGWYGRQSVWAGSENVGIRVSYGHKTRNDYTVGGDGRLVVPDTVIPDLLARGVPASLLEPTTTLPTSYKSRDLDVALGFDLAPNAHLDFNYLRLDQTDVEFPGMVFDINSLATDAFELKYVVHDQPLFDLLTIEGWYNQTRFQGDTLRFGKNRQIPSLLVDLGTMNPVDPATGFAITDVDSYSSGYRMATTWEQPDLSQLTLGTDLIFLGQQLNDIEPERAGRNNFPIPRSHSADIGVFAEHGFPLGDSIKVSSGARFDAQSTDARNFVAGVVENDGSTPRPITEDLHTSSLDRYFLLWSAFATVDYELDQHWTASLGAGYARRALTLTELYADQSFIALLQPGLPFLIGDPELRSPRLKQIDAGLNAEYDRTRVKLTGFYAWINDFVTFDSIEDDPQNFQPGQEQHRVAFTNTDLATIAGFELFSEFDVHANMTAFGTLSYVEGRDRSRSEPSRVGAWIRPDRGRPPDTPRSEVTGADHEPLPGISPLESFVGLRLHEQGQDPRWLVELAVRIVDNQDRVARSLFEQETSGFTVWNLRSYWRASNRLLLVAGVENFTDKFYREHLDTLAGRGVYQPGTNFYFSTELTY